MVALCMVYPGNAASPLAPLPMSALGTAPTQLDARWVRAVLRQFLPTLAGVFVASGLARGLPAGYSFFDAARKCVRMCFGGRMLPAAPIRPVTRRARRRFKVFQSMELALLPDADMGLCASAVDGVSLDGINATDDAATTAATLTERLLTAISDLNDSGDDEIKHRMAALGQMTIPGATKALQEKMASKC